MDKIFKLISIAFFLSISVLAVAQNKTYARVRLKKNMVSGKIVLLPEAMKNEATTYVIRYAYDLAGGKLIIPKNCNLVFKKKGSISNGEIVFSDTWLKGEKFHGLYSASGTLLNKSFDASRYGFVDDTDQLKFLLSQAKNGYSLKLESKIYHINSLNGINRVSYDSAFASFVGLEGISILGNNTIIEDKASKSLIGNYLYSLLQFDGCRNVAIKSLTYKWAEEATLHPKVEGIIFLRTFNECRLFDVNVSVMNAGRGLYSGRKHDKTHNPGRGLCDSKVSIRANHVGYPVAIEKGDRLDISNRFEFAHRGTYLAGVTNSTVFVEGREAYSTKVNLLLTDAADINGCYFCDGIKATVVDSGTYEMTNTVIMAQCNTYSQTDEQFEGRSPYNVKSIELELFTPLGSSTFYEGLVITDMAKVGDTMNITVTGDMADEGKNSRLTRLKDIPKGNITFRSIRSSHNYIIIDSELPDGANLSFEDCPNIEVTIPDQTRNTSGRITFKGCSFLRYIKKETSKGLHLPIVQIEE